MINRVTIDCDNINSAYAVIDTGRSEIDNIRAIQKLTRYKREDFIKAFASSGIAGLGLGSYEAKQFYSPNAFPQFEGTWFYNWFNMPTGGDQWIKFGHPDKISRVVWLTADKYAWNAWIRFFGGNWVYSYLALFTVENSAAGFIRNMAKYGTFFHFSFEIDWKVITSLF